MSKLVWDEAGKRLYETGVDRGLIALLASNGTYQKCIPWNGLSAVTAKPSGAEATPFYANNVKYLNLLSAEDFGVTIEAYTYPDEFKKCVGASSPISGISFGSQKRSHFGFSYRTVVGNDKKGNDYGYKIHLVFNCTAASSEKGYSSVNDSSEPIAFSWEVSTSAINVDGIKPIASIILDSTKFCDAGMGNVFSVIEDRIYGTDKSEPEFLSVNTMLEIIQQEQYIQDSSGDYLLDSSGNQIRSFVYSL